ncbi:MAG: hypothetical protein JXB50_11195, partial [Spirochaetes bacterium]|nr:hypothetical protein [Spirochaetota bacterium]
MKTLNYYLFESPLTKGKFMARTILVNNYTDQQLIDEMKKKNNGISETGVRETLKLMVETARELLAQGISVNVPGFLKISPSVKGSFDTADESFNPARHWVGINCTVSSAFVEDFQKDVTVERSSRPKNWPDIISVTDTETGESYLQTEYATQIIGENLLSVEYELDAVILASRTDENQIAIIERDMLGVVSHKAKELIFTIRKSFIVPAWL